MKCDDVINTLKAHQDELQRMGVTSLALFGSAARDQATDASDVDLMVEFDAKRRIGLFQFYEVQERLEEILGVEKVDLVMRDAVIDDLKDDMCGGSRRCLLSTADESVLSGCRKQGGPHPHG